MCRKLVLGSNPEEFAFLWPGSLGWRTAMIASCGFFESHTSEQKTGSKSVLQGFQAALSVSLLSQLLNSDKMPEPSVERRGASWHHLNSVLITRLGFLISTCPRSVSLCTILWIPRPDLGACFPNQDHENGRLS